MDRIIVIAPHADDEILGCGASIAKHIRKGDEVFVVIATNASVGAPELFSKEGIANVRAEADSAHHFLGVKKNYFLDYPAPRLDVFPNYKISNGLNQIIETVKPNIAYLPHPGDAHLDHKAIFQSSMVALRPISHILEKIYTYETQSETEWAAPYSSEVFFPTAFNIITKADLDMKIKAIDFFKSQLRDNPNPRSIEKIIALAKYRGGIVNAEFAESFYIVREINV